MVVSIVQVTGPFPKNNAEAAVKFGPTNPGSRLPRLREAVIELTYGSNRADLLTKLQIRPVPTSMVAISANLPFSQLLESEYVVRKEGEVFVQSDDRTNARTRDVQPPLLVHIDKRLIVPENMGKLSLIIAEDNWVANEQGGKCIFTMLPGNDQRFAEFPMSSDGHDRFELKSILPFLFNESELKEGKLAAEFLRSYNTERVFSLPNSRAINAQLHALFASAPLQPIGQHVSDFLKTIGKMKMASAKTLSADGTDYSIAKAKDGSVEVSRQFFAYMRFEQTNVPHVGLAMTGDGRTGESAQKVTYLPEITQPAHYGYVLLMEDGHS